MASIDSSLVKDDIKKLISLSQSTKKLTKAAFKQLETDPSQYDELDYVSPDIAERFTNLIALRKIKITTKNHDFRMIFAHWILEDDEEHVDILLVFPRSDGYEIDWDWMETTLDR